MPLLSFTYSVVAKYITNQASETIGGHVTTQFLQCCQKLKNYIPAISHGLVHKAREKKIGKLTFETTHVKIID